MPDLTLLTKLQQPKQTKCGSRFKKTLEL